MSVKCGTNLWCNSLIIHSLTTLQQTNQYKIKIIPSQITKNYTFKIRFKAKHSYNITFLQFSVDMKTILLWLTTFFKTVGQYSQLPLMVQLVWPQDNGDTLNVTEHSYKIYTRHITDMTLSSPQGYSALANLFHLLTIIGRCLQPNKAWQKNLVTVINIQLLDNTNSNTAQASYKHFTHKLAYQLPPSHMTP
jgi:hypothetical protein